MKKKNKEKVKEKWRNDATIKIKTLLKVTENSRDSFVNEEKLINIEIIHASGWSSSRSFSHNEEGKEKAVDFIREELYL